MYNVLTQIDISISKGVCVGISICVVFLIYYYILIFIISSFGAVCKELLRKEGKICCNCTKTVKK